MAYKSPVYHVIPVPIEKVRPNTYNPNAVAPPEMRLLYESIRADGYTMPIVCYYAKSQDIYVIVDGFHRYRVMLEHPDIYEREGGVLPVSVIDKPLDQRMASTIRHNRARGSHDVDLMSNIVKELHELGRSDAWIAKPVSYTHLYGSLAGDLYFFRLFQQQCLIHPNPSPQGRKRIPGGSQRFFRRQPSEVSKNQRMIDVYKRQHFTLCRKALAGAGSAEDKAVRVFELLAVNHDHVVGAVSYTHLDVYKRQV